MSQEIINIPRINDTPYDFSNLFEIWSQVNSYFEDVRFDFTACDFLRPNAVAFLGGLARLIESRHGKVEFNWNSFCNSKVFTNLCQNGFAGTFGYPSTAWQGESIPYREDVGKNMNGIMDYLAFNWIGRGWVHVSSPLRDAISEKMWEIFDNAFEHSGSEIGVFSCGQHFPRGNRLVLSVIDFGQGIPAKIRSFLRLHSTEDQVSKLTGAGCLRWAFKSGNSTSMLGVARGLGLDLLKAFVQRNQGKLEVYSNEGYGIINSDGERYENREISFEGTIFHITLRCDEKYYYLKSEDVLPL